MKKRKVGQLIIFGLLSLVFVVFLEQQVSATIFTKQSNSCGTSFVSSVGNAQGADRTTYRRYLDYRRGREAINSAACGREYWISPTSGHPNYGVRFVYLVDGRGQRVEAALYYEAGDGSLRLFRNADEARLPNPFAGDLGISNNGNVANNPPVPTPQPQRPNQRNTPVPRNSPPPTNNSSPASNNQSQAEIINAHNRWRSQVNSPPLSWSNDLARVAQDWADQLSRSGGNISHRPNNSYGENIYWAAGGGLSGTDAVDSWGSEIRYFKNGNFPDVSTTGRWSDVGHYTQIIWSTTTQVGCGSAQTGNQIIWVCNYNPPGNYQGRNPLSR